MLVCLLIHLTDIVLSLSLTMSIQAEITKLFIKQTSEAVLPYPSNN